MSNAVLVLILMLSAIAAILSGMAVFTNNRPPDARLGQVLEDLDEVKGLLQQLQKQVMQIERRLDKDMKESKNEIRESLDRVADRIERRLMEAIS